MGWSEVATRSHARRLEREGWLKRYPMAAGDGSLFVASLDGVRASGVRARPMRNVTAALWPKHCARAWVAAWLTVRGREMLGYRELLLIPEWSQQLHWWDFDGYHTTNHRPDLVAFVDGVTVPIEIAIHRTTAERAQASLSMHFSWMLYDKTGALMIVCADAAGRDRLQRAAQRAGLLGRLQPRLEVLDGIREQAITASEGQRAVRAGRLDDVSAETSR
jgi:hypothetical protein